MSFIYIFFIALNTGTSVFTEKILLSAGNISCLIVSIQIFDNIIEN